MIVVQRFTMSDTGWKGQWPECVRVPLYATQDDLSAAVRDFVSNLGPRFVSTRLDFDDIVVYYESLHKPAEEG